jgi:hypothetical protein
MTGITERIGGGTAQRSTASCRFSEIQIQELHNGVGTLVHTITALTKSFTARFPSRPKGLVQRIGKIVGDYYLYLFLAAFLFLFAAMRFHWPFVFEWFGYKLGTVTVAKDVRSVFLIP